MKQLIFTLAIVATLFACKKYNPLPVGDLPSGSIECTTQSNAVHLLLAGTPAQPKKWKIAYYSATSTNDTTRLSVPTLISPTQFNTFYWEPNDSLKEFSYDGHLMDVGVWKLQSCGTISLINTTLSGGDNPFVLEIVQYNYWQGTFFIPAGPNGSSVKVRIKAYLVQ